MIATKAVSGEVLIFDRTKHPSEPERTGVCKPDIRLVGQNEEGSVLGSPLAADGVERCILMVNTSKVRTGLEPE